MAASDDQVELVRRQIDKAFADTPYPGDANLVYDTSGYHLECNEIADDFCGKHWKELPVDFLRRNHASIYFLTPAAYHFYLPAYLLAVVVDYDEADAIVDSVVHSLTGPLDIPSPERDCFLERVKGFTEEQSRAIVLFLEFLRDDCPDWGAWDPEWAAHSYWRGGLQKPQTGG